MFLVALCSACVTTPPQSVGSEPQATPALSGDDNLVSSEQADQPYAGSPDYVGLRPDPDPSTSGFGYRAELQPVPTFAPSVEPAPTLEYGEEFDTPGTLQYGAEFNAPEDVQAAPDIPSTPYSTSRRLDDVPPIAVTEPLEYSEPVTLPSPAEQFAQSDAFAQPEPLPGPAYEPNSATAPPAQLQQTVYLSDAQPEPEFEPQSPIEEPAAENDPFALSATSTGGAYGIVLGEGDVILFAMFGQEDLETTAFVSADGSVSLPLIGETQVGGLTPGEAEQQVAQAYRSGGFFKNPQVNIVLETFRSQQISVLGEVNTPGRYPLETRTTVLDALAEAEGIMPTGSRIVTVIRKTDSGTARRQVDIDKLVSNSGQLDSLQLAPGDIVFVPEAQLFYIYGEVRKPDAYAIKPGMTVMQALSLGGGLTDKGSNSRIVIQRKDAGGERSLKPELTEKVQPDDVIYVKERFF